MQGYNLIVVFSEDRTKMLMCRRLKEPYMGLYNFVGGKIEKGEDGIDAAYRELREETGCTAGRFVPMGKLIPTCAYDTEVIHLFFASELTRGEQDLDENEFLSVERYTLDEALQMVLDGEIIDAKTQIGLLKYQALRKAGRI